MNKTKKKKEKEFAVLGLGYFGMSAAEVLAVDYGANVLACDNDPRKVQYASAFATQAIQIDVSDEKEIERLELDGFDVVIIATGDDFEAAINAVTVAKEKGVPHIIVKAESKRQKSILEKMGADRVVFPEREMGEKVARNLLNKDIMDVLRDADSFTIAEMTPDEAWVGKKVAESNMRATHEIIILAIKRGYKVVAPVGPSEVIQADDILVVWKENH